MLKITKAAPDQINIALSGKLDETTMRDGLEELLTLSQGMKNAKMLYTIHGFEWPTLAALGVEFSMMPRLFSLINRFDHCAVLCDESWIRSAAKIE
ncbi:MAG: STAS/SEC14 domain-containing protein, partial [Rhizobiaceae bacterium]